MAQNEVKDLSAEAWTQLTDADITSITFLVRRAAGGVYIAGTTTASAPTDFTAALLYKQGQGERNVAMSDLFPGITAVRVYAHPVDDTADVFVSHG